MLDWSTDTNFSKGKSNVVRIIQIFSKAISYLFVFFLFFWEIVCYGANIVRKNPIRKNPTQKKIYKKVCKIFEYAEKKFVDNFCFRLSYFN